jgi:LPXTG-site transpeptidase (sortase) family protein
MERVIKIVSSLLIFLGLSLLFLIFWPTLKVELKYNFDQIAHVKYVLNTEQLSTFEKPLTAPNTDFSIIIPKIGAVAPIVANVDPSDPKIYLPALKKGVAQAQGSALPGEEGNVYLFAHSTDAFYNVGTYNAVFFLIGKLQSGDEVDIYYQDKLFKYTVYDKRVVSADSIQYFGVILPGEKTLTLQTCYPPGTTFERLVVLAKGE